MWYQNTRIAIQIPGMMKKSERYASDAETENIPLGV